MNSPFVPLYSRVLDALRQRVSDGTFHLGKPLPTESQLVREFGVSRHTVRAALQYLVNEGIIERTAGRGTFLKRPSANSGQWTIGGIDDLIDVGLSRPYSVKSSRFVPASRHPRIAGILNVFPSSKLFNVRAVRSTDEGPFAYSSLYFSEEIGAKLPQDQFESKPFLLLVEEYCGFPVARTRQVASAKLADGASAKLLGVERGYPLLVMERTHFARDGRSLQFSRVEYRTDRYQQVVYFSRREAGSPRARDETRNDIVPGAVPTSVILDRIMTSTARRQ